MVTTTTTTPALTDNVRTHLSLVLKQNSLAEHLVKDHGVTEADLPKTKQAQSRLHTTKHQDQAATVVTVDPPATPKAAPAEVAKPAEAAPEQPKADPEAEMKAAQIAALQAQLAELTGQAVPTEAKPAKPKKPEYGAAEAKQELFRMAVMALDTMVYELPKDHRIIKALGKDEAARSISQAIHHFPTGRNAEGAKMWEAQTLPKPQRSSWK
jgi:hypothetical protein